MSKIEFIVPEAEFSQAGQETARRVLHAMPLQVPPLERPRADFFTPPRDKNQPEPLTPYEKLAAALEQQKDMAGFKEVAAYVASARYSEREDYLSNVRTAAVVQGLESATRVARPAPQKLALA